MSERPANIPFNRPTLQGREWDYIRETLDGAHFAAQGPFTRRVEERLQTHFGASQVLLTHSCSAALEIAALLTVKAGDEVIVPSFAFPTMASAFARCGAVLVFVDIRPDTFNIDPKAVAAALTPRTRAIVGVHYAGVSCDVDALRSIAQSANAVFIEDAAHAFGATHRGRPLGTFGELATLSFHETKNIISGEGGALVVNAPELVERARIIRDRGTNRHQFFQGVTDQYTWVELGSAYAPSDLVAAVLLAQIEEVETITAERLRLWQRYHNALAVLEQAKRLRRPCVPADAGHNAHIYHLLLADPGARPAVLAALKANGIEATFHYVPLHSSPAGVKHGRTVGMLPVTDDVATRILRLPMHLMLDDSDQDAVIEAVNRQLAG